MSVEFTSKPMVKESPIIAVCVWGRDSETEDYVEYRVTHAALRTRDANVGFQYENMISVHNDHVDEFEQAARRKYAAGQVKHEHDLIVVWLDKADFSR